MSQPQPTTRGARTRPPRSLCAISGAAAAPSLVPVDWSAWHLTDEDDMGESPEQGEIIRVLLPTLEQLARERGWAEAYVGADNFFAWVEEAPLVRVSPDVYLLRRQPPRPLPRSFQTWLEGHHAPALAFEIVSEDWRKDYEEGPQKYALLGVEELVIFDPHAEKRPATRTPLQVYRWTADEHFVPVHQGPGPARCAVLGAWLVAADAPEGPRLRIARDAAGEDLVPTPEEAHDEERAARLEERAARLEERAARLDAEREVARLRAELERRDR